MTHGHRPGRDDALGERRERLLEQHAALASLTQSPVFHGDDLEETIRHVTGMAARLMHIERVSLWRYTEARTAIPPESTLRTLLDLARQGNIGALREQALRLAALDPPHAAFAGHMGGYLEGFQMKKLRQWLEQLDRP
ncbi:MAG: hypothetical protein ACT4QB_00880 [Gammaproteobacteria bacterium]